MYLEYRRMCLMCNTSKFDAVSALARMSIVNENVGTVGGGAGLQGITWKMQAAVFDGNLKQFTEISAQVAALVVTQVVVCGETIVAVVHYVSENADTAGGGCRVSLGSA
jgi:hypothetical protein